MLYHLSLYLREQVSWLNVVHYVSFRCMASLITALVLSLVFGQWFMAKSKLFFRSKTREYTPEAHRQKDDTPTMGGLFVLGIVTITALLWCDLTNPRVWLFLFCLISFGALGFWDDWSKIKHKKGISASAKFVAQWTIALLVALGLLWCDTSTTVVFPFFKSWQPDLGWLFVPWAMFVLVAISNAVNLTDGLDGLAIGSLIPNFATFSLICYIAGHFRIASYLNIPFAMSAEVAVIGAILVGASLGFLWYNSYPAQIFMGDVGSLALGGGLALMALMAKQELLLVIAGGLFVVETVSVILQVFSYKVRGRRIFKMAPIHHHFELLGSPESKIVARFGIISLILCLLALMTIKLR